MIQYIALTEILKYIVQSHEYKPLSNTNIKYQEKVDSITFFSL